MARVLTEKQKRFAENKYISGMNGRTAARLAGYKAGALDRAAYNNTRKVALRDYALSKIKEHGLSDKVIDAYKTILEEKPAKPPTYQDKIAVGREIAAIEGHYAPKRQEKISVSLSSKSDAELLIELEDLRKQLALRTEDSTKSVDK